jgi:hypothetical protein
MSGTDWGEKLREPAPVAAAPARALSVPCMEQSSNESAPKPTVPSISPISIADLLPQVRGVLPLTDIDALNKMCLTLCRVIEDMLTTPSSALALTHEAVAVPAPTPAEFLHAALLDGPQPAKAVERVAREQHGWHPRILFKARQRLRVKAMRRGFGPGGHWFWKLPEDATDRAIYFHLVSGAIGSRATEQASIAQLWVHRHRFLPLTTRI